MTDQTAAIEVLARVLCAADAHVHGCPTWQQLPTAPGPSGRSQDDYRKVAAWLLPRMTVADPAEQAPACPDPIECGHEAALGQAREETRRLGLMVDEYGAGASALTDKLRRARERHRETCILARGEVKPTAFRCGLCEVLDAPAAPLRRMADEAQQPSLGAEDCTCIPFTRKNGVQRYCQPGDTVDMISGWEIGGDCPHHRDAVKAQPECTASRSAHCLREAESETACDTEAGECVHGGKPAVEAQQPARHIQCPEAFWRPRPEAPHDWQQRPDAQPVHCPGVPAAQQPKGARS